MSEASSHARTLLPLTALLGFCTTPPKLERRRLRQGYGRLQTLRAEGRCWPLLSRVATLMSHPRSTRGWGTRKDERVPTLVSDPKPQRRIRDSAAIERKVAVRTRL